LFPEKSQNKKDPNLVIFGANGSASIRQWDPSPEEDKKAVIPSTTTSVEPKEPMVPATSGSIGSKLLMQFKKLSAEKGVERSDDEDEDDEDDDDEDEDDEEEEEEEDFSDSGEENSEDDEQDSDDEEEKVEEENADEIPLLVPLDGPVYQPIEIQMPIDHQGKILVSEEIAQKSNQRILDSLSRQEKMKYLLERDPKIQVFLFFSCSDHFPMTPTPPPPPSLGNTI
jgi:hypothetical protein